MTANSIEASVDAALEKLNNAPNSQDAFILAAFSLIIDEVGEEAALQQFLDADPDKRGSILTEAIQVGIVKLDNDLKPVLNPAYLEHKRKVDAEIREMIDRVTAVPEDQFEAALGEVIAEILR